MKLHRGRKQSLHPKASIASLCAAPCAEFAIDVGRFFSTESVKEQESHMPNTLASFSVGDSRDTVYAPQVPPANSLLLMRNSKSRTACATLNSSLSRTIADSHECGVFVEGDSNARQAFISLSRGSSSMHDSSSLLEGKVGELEIAAMANGHDVHGAYLSELHLQRLCEIVAQECKPLHGKKNAMAYRQATLPKATPEARLWQRRCVMKPSELMVGRPIALQVNQPTTR
ncbi:hypothetical protein L7F22_011071 [Adiantum nelumboides]|nr:hypothetical protein [Adiantum nelumboides]